LRNKLHKQVYIPSVEGSDIYNYIFRSREIHFKYIGMIPSSLELNKLISVGFKITKKGKSEQYQSDDIINVKFKHKVNSGIHLIKKLSEKMLTLDDSDDYKHKLNELIQSITSELHTDKWHELSYEELRKKLYTDGFSINGIHYVVYKRSSAKSRVGQCLFIKEELYDEMIKWGRMELNLENIDYPSLLAYESLVGSSLEETVYIDPKNIFIVEDVESKFSQICNVIRTGSNGYLDSFEEKTQISNSLFDGESLLESKYFHTKKGMMLLRNHMFKSAAFNCNIQKFLKDSCPDHINFDDWTLIDMFGNAVPANSIHLITTPSSLKALKFSCVLGSENDMWGHWKKIVTDDGCIFGICKNEKPTKHGMDNSGCPIQQTSYQMLNSLFATPEEIHSLTEFESQFIEKLKNNDQFFIKYIEKTSNEMNSNLMFVDLYQRNNEIVNTKLFRRFRSDEINKHVTHVKNGKVRLRGDYMVMLGNPMEFLLHSINRLDLKNSSLKGNQAFAKSFPFKELTGFRNPHTSPSNVLIAKNTYVKDIDEYFNLSSNIVCVNAIDFPLQDILSGSDYDSDTILLFDDINMLNLAKKTNGKYRVCINRVVNSKKQYNITRLDMSEIDNELSKSQRFIGRTVNLGQLCMSTYWDYLNSGIPEDELLDLMKKVDVVTVLSSICIDLAKKMFEIDIRKEIDHVAKTNSLKKLKPLFWKYVSQNGDIATIKYACPMDYLWEEMNSIEKAKTKTNIDFKMLIIKGQHKRADRHQQEKIIHYVTNMCLKLNNTYASNYDDTERDILVDQTIKYYTFYLEKLKVNSDTMYALLNKIAKHKKDKIAIRLLYALHKTQKETFLNSFKHKTPHFL
jgi:hypothetical protein